MPDVKISELPLAEAVTGAEQVPVIQGTSTRRAAPAALLAGRTIPGTLAVAAPTAPDHVSRKGDLDAVGVVANGAVPKSGGTMTGPLVLSADGTSDLHAVTRRQLQAAISALIGGATPATLDTLSEIAAALGSSKDLAAAMTQQIAGKLDRSAAGSAGLALLGTATPQAARDSLGLKTAASRAAEDFVLSAQFPGLIEASLGTVLTRIGALETKLGQPPLPPPPVTGGAETLLLSFAAGTVSGMSGGTLADLVTVTRASVATALRADGTTVSFAAGKARLTDRGLLVEPGSRQIVVSTGNALGNGTADSDWYKDNVTYTDLGVDADARFRAVKVDCPDAGGRSSFAAIRRPEGKVYNGSVWYRAGTTKRARLHIQVFSGGNGLSHLAGPVGDLSAQSQDAGVFSNVVNRPVAGGVYRLDYTFTPSPALAAAEMGVGLGADGVGSVIVLGANLSEGAGSEDFVRGPNTTPGEGAKLAGAALAARQMVGATVDVTPSSGVTIAGDGTITVTVATYIQQIQIVRTSPPGDQSPGGLARTVRTTDAAGGTIPFILGVNLAGADFGNIDGPIGQQYGYPDNEQADYFVGRGLKAIRLPIKWERIQPTRGGEFRAQDINELDRIVKRVHDAGGYPIVDVHNYFVRHEGGATMVIRNQIPQSHFNDLWKRLAERYKGLPRCMFNLMNEPVHSDTNSMLTAFNEAAVEIRRTGAKNLLLVPGNHYTGAHSWVGSDNDDVMGGFTDPENNWAYDMHQYLDQDSSGTGATAVKGKGATCLVAATEWLRAKGRRAFLGEFNWGANAGGETEGRALLKYMSDNRSVWVGGTWWMATNRLSPGDDEYDADPASYSNPVDRSQVTILRQALGL